MSETRTYLYCVLNVYIIRITVASVDNFENKIVELLFHDNQQSM